MLLAFPWLVGCSFDVSGPSLGWLLPDPDGGAGKKDWQPTDIRRRDSKKKPPKKDSGKKKLDKGTKPKKDTGYKPPDKGQPPKPDKYVKPPQLDKGQPPKQDKGYTVVDQAVTPTSWYGKTCEPKYIGKTCPDQKTTCIKSATSNTGICTHKCGPGVGWNCPQGPQGTKTACGQWGMGWHCFFYCLLGGQNYKCPSAGLNCKHYKPGEKHCWP